MSFSFLFLTKKEGFYVNIILFDLGFKSNNFLSGIFFWMQKKIKIMINNNSNIVPFKRFYPYKNLKAIF